MRDPIGQQRKCAAGADPAKHDRELANNDQTIEFTDSSLAGNKKPDTSQNSDPRLEIGLCAFPAIPTRNQTLALACTRLRQF